MIFARNKMKNLLIVRMGVMFSCFMLTACVGHRINEATCTGGPCTYPPERGYRFHPEWKPDRETLFIVTASGGGLRAAALAYGALEALSELPSDEGPGSLLEDVDVISSVSGGSVTAAWYAVRGPNGFPRDPIGDNRVNQDNPFITFLKSNGTLELALRSFNPAALAEYIFTSKQRSDVLADYFDEKLFRPSGDGANPITYDYIEHKYTDTAHRGYVILNATDVGHETVFPFTQNNFDLICSDFGKIRLADALAASADFPFAFSAVGIKNYSLSCSQESKNIGSLAWIHDYDQYDNNPNTPLQAQTRQLPVLRDARLQKLYLNPPPGDVDLHLLDGGLADNLGIQSTLRLADRPDRKPGLDRRIAHVNDPQWNYSNQPGYSKIKRVLFLVINARTKDDPSGVDNSLHPVSLISTALRTIDTPMDSTTLDVQNLLTSELGEARGRGIKPFVVSVDFEMIPDQKCRNVAWGLGTNWHFPDNTVDGLIELGRALVMRSPDLDSYYRASGRAEVLAHRKANPATACGLLQNANTQ
jgi:NTE family protein